MDAYRKGLTGISIAALYTVKQYKSHRRISENVIDYIDYNNNKAIFLLKFFNHMIKIFNQ